MVIPYFLKYGTVYYKNMVRYKNTVYYENTVRYKNMVRYKNVVRYENMVSYSKWAPFKYHTLFHFLTWHDFILQYQTSYIVVLHNMVYIFEISQFLIIFFQNILAMAMSDSFTPGIIRITGKRQSTKNVSSTISFIISIYYCRVGSRS